MVIYVICIFVFSRTLDKFSPVFSPKPTEVKFRAKKPGESGFFELLILGN